MYLSAEDDGAKTEDTLAILAVLNVFISLEN
jgi:hypothetical protein